MSSQFLKNLFLVTFIALTLEVSAQENMTFIENSIAEYYAAQKSYSRFRNSDYQHKYLADTNIYLTFEAINTGYFLKNVQNFQQIPHYVIDFSFGKMVCLLNESDTTYGRWRKCRIPRITNDRGVNVLVVHPTYYEGDTLVVSIGHQRLCKTKEAFHGRIRTVWNWEIGEGMIFKYLYLPEKQRWECVSKFEWGI